MKSGEVIVEYLRYFVVLLVALCEGRVGAVVATELDAPDPTHVINLDLPTDVGHYTQQAGGGGRKVVFAASSSVPTLPVCL